MISTPPSEMTINGLVWAGANLSASKTFASSSTSYGYYFSWADARSACPSPWRLPTSTEYGDIYSGSYTTNTWVASPGLTVKLKSGSQSIVFPTSGIYSGGTGPSGNSAVGQEGYYWASDQYSSTSAYMLQFSKSNSAGQLSFTNKNNGLSVRCVRTP